MFLALTIIIMAYLIGAIPFGLIIARIFGVADIRKIGSGNIGATNVYRAAGIKAALWVFLFDIGKGVLPVLLALKINQNFLPHNIFLIIVLLATVFGHIFPIYLGFKGGKGVNTALGGFLVILPLEILVCVMVFFIITGISKFVSLGSIIAAVLFPCLIVLEKLVFNIQTPDLYLYLAIFVALMVIVTHRKNIKRLLSGTENKLTFGQQTKKAGSGA